jgi:hypothetical protein
MPKGWRTGGWNTRLMRTAWPGSRPTCPPTRPLRPGTASPLLHGDCRDRQKPGRSPSLRADLCGDWLLGGMSTTTDGYGPIPPSMARKLTADGAGSFYRVLVDPRDGAPLEIGRTSYRLTKAMRTPGQRSRPHPCLGQRWHHRVSNLGQPCPKHHRLRHTSRWKPTPPTKNEPPSWTSPSGRHYRGRAPGLGTTPLASPIKASHQRLGAGDWQRAGGSWTYTAAGSSSPAVSTSAISAGRGTKRTNMALKPGVLDSRATFSLWTRALASGKYAAAQPLAVG